MGNGPLKTQNAAKASVSAAGYEEERAAWVERGIFGRDDIERDGGALSAHTMGCRTLREALEAAEEWPGHIPELQ